MSFGKEVLDIDPEREAVRVCEFIESQVLGRYKRKGVVVGLSGGVDSALLACLCVRALGAERVHGLILPERDSAEESAIFASRQATALGIEAEVEELTPLLEGLGVYEDRNRVISTICNSFDADTDTAKIRLPENLLEKDSLNVFSLVVTKPSGEVLSYRLKPDHLHAIASAQNVKQRIRMIQLYRSAEIRHFVVGGTTNRTEMEQGFFVKYGDGGVDIEPLAHLFKTQIFELAAHTGVLKEIRERAPTPDTWPGGVSDEEFYFRMPYKTLDLLLFAWMKGLSVEVVGSDLNLTEEQVHRAYRDLQSKHRSTWHLRTLPPSLLEEPSRDSGGSN